jgi:peptide chain release factor 2
LQYIVALSSSYQIMYTRDFISLPADDDALLSECETQTFRAGGKGGQHQNKVESGVRLIHRPTGIAVESREERSQYVNKLRCLKKLRLKVAALNYRPPERVPTRTPASVRLKARIRKQHRSDKKQLRRRPNFGE